MTKKTNKKSLLPQDSARPLTPKEKAVLEFIETHMMSSGISPSYQEIRDHFGLASFNSVQNYLKQLNQKGYIEIPAHQKRAIRILRGANSVQEETKLRLASAQPGPPRAPLLQASGEALSLPLLGRVAAGQPLEHIKHDEFVSVPPFLVKRPDSSFVLEVEGDSMIDEGIFNGDYLIVQRQTMAKNGDIVVASVDNEATVKKFFFSPPKGDDEPRVELRPANPRLKSMWFAPDELEIKGLVIGLVRRYS